VELVCTDAPDHFPPSSPDLPRMWPLSFDRAPAPFTRADFDEDAPTVTVQGNLVDASQGKQEKEAVLGNGDGRQGFQTFPLPKAPLTYRLSAGSVPPHVPALEIRVNDRLWTRVDSFYGRSPRETVYVVREDGEGRSFVQFGDGETGARLPSGVKNVRAAYRSGVGARGALKPGAQPTTAERPAGFDKVTLAGSVSGGADPEDPGKAREAAPGKVQSLGRLVSLPDVVSETLAIPGVVTASAVWDLHGGVPAVILRVLLEAGREAEFAAVRAAILRAQRCRGPDRHPLVVVQARRRHLFLDLTYARDPGVGQEDLEAALGAALGLAGDGDHERSGLFGLRGRRLGDGEYASRIEGRLQQLPGVLWCQVTALGLFAAPAPGGAALPDPSTLSLPAAPRPLAARLDCALHELLQLAPAHLTLTASAEASAGECP
jgi:predicted phage baseplate assembly protein